MKKLALILVLLGAFSIAFASPGDSTLVTKGFSLTEDQKNSIKNEIVEAINGSYEGISEYTGFELAASDYLNKKLTGEKNPNNSDLADFYLCTTLEHFPSKNFMKELVQERIDKIKEDGFPMDADRYFVTVIERGGKSYILTLLDEKYISPN